MSTAIKAAQPHLWFGASCGACRRDVMAAAGCHAAWTLRLWGDVRRLGSEAAYLPLQPRTVLEIDGLLMNLEDADLGRMRKSPSGWRAAWMRSLSHDARKGSSAGDHLAFQLRLQIRPSWAASCHMRNSPFGCHATWVHSLSCDARKVARKEITLPSNSGSKADLLGQPRPECAAVLLVACSLDA